jgi:hypothetical protein
MIRAACCDGNSFINTASVKGGRRVTSHGNATP